METACINVTNLGSWDQTINGEDGFLIPEALGRIRPSTDEVTGKNECSDGGQVTCPYMGITWRPSKPVAVHCPGGRPVFSLVCGES